MPKLEHRHEDGFIIACLIKSVNIKGIKMLILNSNKDCIHDTAYIQRLVLSPKKDDGVYLICAAISMNEPMLTLGRYYSKDVAKDVFLQLFSALIGGAGYFEMPMQCDLNAESQKKDARTKRKGGS